MKKIRDLRNLFEKPVGKWGFSVLLPFAAFIALMIGIKFFFIRTFANATPFWDQWDAEAMGLYKPLLEGNVDWTSLFGPHNEHRILTTRLLAIALLKFNGIWDPILQMAVNACIHTAVLCLLFVFITRVVNRNFLLVLLSFGIILFGLPVGWENTLAGFQVGFYFVIGFGVLSSWYTVMSTPLSGKWWFGAVCSILAFLSLASGVLVIGAAAAVAILMFIMGLRRTKGQVIAAAILAIMAIISFKLTPILPHHEYLRAKSLSSFINAAVAIFSWPMQSGTLGLLIMQSPSILFLVCLLKSPPTTADPRWFIFVLIVCFATQIASLAYGRAMGGLQSRYFDLALIYLLVNAGCLFSLLSGSPLAGLRSFHVGAYIWICLVVSCLVLNALPPVYNQLSAKRQTGASQEFNTLNYVRTGDDEYLMNKPRLMIPYPKAERLMSILQDPTVRSILPSNIRESIQPVGVNSTPTTAFVEKGYYKTTPTRYGMTIGSYGAYGNASTGELRLEYRGTSESAYIALPLAGYPLMKGMSVEFEQGGKRRRVKINDNSKETWVDSIIRVRRGNFAIILKDGSKNYWLAIGEPKRLGYLEGYLNMALANFDKLLLLGVSIILILLLRYSLQAAKGASFVQGRREGTAVL